MIRNIVFDMGGVLYHWSPEIAFRDYGEEDGQILYDAVYGSPDWRRLDRGDIGEDDLIALASARVPDRLKPEVVRLARWYELTGPVEGMEELADELHGAGYPLYLLSNTSRAFHSFRGRIPALRFFTGEFISADHRLLKPDPEIFRAFLAEFGLRAEESLFIDDWEPNVEGARSVGMEGIRFDGSARDLRNALSARNLLPSVPMPVSEAEPKGKEP